jgi:hypothetical protein
MVNTNIGVGDDRDCCFSRVCRISVSGMLTALDHSEAPAALAAGDHYREMASKLRELARLALHAGHPQGAGRLSETVRPARRSSRPPAG